MDPATMAAANAAGTDGMTELNPTAPPPGYPPCPVCSGEGRGGSLLPLAGMTFWACSDPSCTYMISTASTGVTLYKGHAKTQMKERGGKRWVEFEF